jgi:putative flippase GtrA
VGTLLARLDSALAGVPAEIIFVDASTDGTAEALDELRERAPRDIVVLNQRTASGLGAAVAEGLRAARAPWVCVMDGDLQHPPELVPMLLERAESGEADLVVASRYCEHGSAGGLGRLRALASRSTTAAARLIFPRRLHDVRDPMSGFFLVRRDAIAIDELRPRGFKILLEVLVRNPDLRVAEVSYAFAKREAGQSKAGLREGFRYLSLLVRLRFARFGLVGLSGLVVNTVLLAVLTDVVGLFYVVSAVIATQGSTLWNFWLTERWVFADREHRRGWGTRLAMFLLMNNVALLIRGPLLVVLTSGLGIHYVVSNLISLVGLTVLRFVLADNWIWAPRPPRATPVPAQPVTHAYDIHGIVTLLSDTPLPELERFRVAALVDGPDIRVRLGKARSTGASSLCYREAIAGFGVAITTGDRIDVIASRLLRWSPHVLYTNVVEPILRWTFAERGYALVHAACVAAGKRAYLVTARTDTGKTTTTLRLLDEHPYSFLSDDLTLIAPDGHVLTYPKPLTISRHTLHAVRTPLLSRRERAGLLVQSRLHSRSGRRFALVLARTHLPAATINAVVQMLVPPPKYHVERLVPGVEVAPEAQLAGLIVIQRGGDGEVVLDEHEALETLMRNCEDAYGFPPYAAMEGFLRHRNGSDLRRVERGIVARALSNVPATVLRSETMDWSRRLPDVVRDWTPEVRTNGTLAASSNGASRGA